MIKELDKKKKIKQKQKKTKKQALPKLPLEDVCTVGIMMTRKNRITKTRDENEMNMYM